MKSNSNWTNLVTLYLARIRGFLGNVAVVCVSLYIALLCAEGLLRTGLFPLEALTGSHGLDVAVLAKEAAERRAAPYDSREIYEIIMARRAENPRTYPTLSSAYFASDTGSKISVAGKPVLPLSINPQADSFYCKESGQATMFTTDRYGFRNKDSVWDGRASDVLMLGDSFTFGSCLEADKSIAGRLRSSGKKVITLGIGANGPLAELGALREYGKKAAPKTVVWMFFPNDISDLARERQNSIYIKYLDPAFSQGLAGMAAALQGPMDREADAYLERQKVAFEAMQKAGGVKPSKPFYRLPSLVRLVKFVRNALKDEKAAPTPAAEVIKPFMEVFARAQADVRQMGGKLMFVYLPDCKPDSEGQALWKDALLTAVSDSGVPVIDAEIFMGKHLPHGLSDAFYYCPGSHYNEAGAQAAAQAIVEGLRSH